MRYFHGIVRIHRLPDRSVPSLAPYFSVSFIKPLEVSKVFVQKIKDCVCVCVCVCVCERRKEEEVDPDHI